jgi:hypothetical protein
VQDVSLEQPNGLLRGNALGAGDADVEKFGDRHASAGKDWCAMIGTPELILFGIQAGLRIYAAGRQAYIDGTRDRAIILPLPRPVDETIDTVVGWFNLNDEGRRIRDQTPAVQALLQHPAQNANELKSLRTLYMQQLDPNTAINERPISAGDLAALVSVRQWAAGDSGAPLSPLQQLGGTLIDVAVDFFANTPGVVSLNRPEGRLLLAFLKAADSVEFASTPAKELAPQLLVGVFRAVAITPELLVGGQKEQLLLGGISTSLATAINTKLTNSTALDRQNAKEWVEVLAASFAKGAANTVLSNPSIFLPGGGDATTKVLQVIVSQITDLAIGPDRFTLQNVISEDGLTKIIRSALGAVALNPDIIPTSNPGLRKLIVEISQTLADSPMPAAKDLAPTIVEIVLNRSAANLDALWGGDRQDPGHNLLVVASKQTLTALAAAFGPGEKPPTFVKDQLLSILDAVFAQVEETPEWLVDHLDTSDPKLKPVLGAALTAVLQGLKGHPPSKLSASLASDIVVAALGAVSAKVEFLNRLPVGGAEAQAALTIVVREVLSSAFNSTAPFPQRWQLIQTSTIRALMAEAFSALAKKGITAPNLEVLRTVLQDLSNAGILPGELGLPAAFAKKLESALEN